MVSPLSRDLVINRFKYVLNASTVVPTNTAPPNTASLPIPHFKSQIGFLKVIIAPHNTAVSEYRWTDAGFSQVPRTGVLGGTTVVEK